MDNYKFDDPVMYTGSHLSPGIYIFYENCDNNGKTSSTRCRIRSVAEVDGHYYIFEVDYSNIRHLTDTEKILYGSI